MNLHLFASQSLLFKHPLFITTAFFALGIATYFYTFLGIIIACCIAIAIFFQPYNKFIYIITIATALGFARTHILAHNHSQAIAGLTQLNKEITICITNIEKTNRNHLPWMIEGTILKAPPESNAINNYSLKIYTQRKPLFQVDDTIKFTPPHHPSTTNESFNRFMIRNSLIGIFFISDFTYTLEQHFAWSINRSIHNLKTAIIYRLQRKMRPDVKELFNSLFLGKKVSPSKYLNDLKQQHKQWGTSHYLARSGLHMTIFIMGWQALLKLFPLASALQYLIVSLLALLYAILSWQSISFFRALLIFLLAQIAMTLQRKTNTFLQVILASFLVLINNPFHLSFLDFQLSFGLTLALALAHVVISNKRVQNAQTVAL